MARRHTGLASVFTEKRSGTPKTIVELSKKSRVNSCLQLPRVCQFAAALTSKTIRIDTSTAEDSTSTSEASTSTSEASTSSSEASTSSKSQTWATKASSASRAETRGFNTAFQATTSACFEFSGFEVASFT
ncbi:hypothetical protein XA68_17586 [Ophiocordyceps unilateralis]|uniref:Uncharacterized protein n=1 Tax=Ophiocordyceps unilateralis TaxID=268505 RepID=A0A2A9P4J6_OPHUN|nr:hypothetical protein XA68_17586 [Ophiocordyceps unilateralis]